ncbi:Rho termination factor N-terminal domain-containing protein [Agromyces humi]
MAELRQLARARGVAGYSRFTKAQLVVSLGG